jgi:hypothetical protein
VSRDLARLIVRGRGIIMCKSELSVGHSGTARSQEGETVQNCKSERFSSAFGDVSSDCV